ncbi:MAG: NAD(P) transhydrogenase subunit alpha [Bacilli bacterium]
MEIILVSIFVVATIIGYFLINNVPSLLHTPLMSGMNALSGVSVLGALIATAEAMEKGYVVLGGIFGSIAIILAMINVVGGFAVTDRMLKMFVHKGEKHD